MSETETTEEIISLCLDSRVAFSSWGMEYPVTDLLDDDGDSVEDPEEAVVAVAGIAGRWFSIDLREYEDEFHSIH